MVTHQAVRPQLTQKEVWAFKQLVGTLNVLLQNESEITDRAKMVKNGYRDLRLITSRLTKLYQEMWHTIPPEQQKRLNAEFRNTITYIDVKRPQDNGKDEGFTYMPTSAIERLAYRVMMQECLFCEKCGKTVNRCQIRKDLESTYQWKLDRLPDGTCPFRGMLEDD